MKKNILLLSFMILVAAFYSNSYASEMNESLCREKVVDAALYFDVVLEKDSIGNTKFEDLSLTIETVNALDSKSQQEIYDKIKPLENYVENYSSALANEYRSILEFAYRNNAFMVLFEEIQKIKNLLEGLEEACSTSSN